MWFSFSFLCFLPFFVCGMNGKAERWGQARDKWLCGYVRDLNRKLATARLVITHIHEARNRPYSQEQEEEECLLKFPFFIFFFFLFFFFLNEGRSWRPPKSLSLDMEMKRNERESHKLLMVFRFINNSTASPSEEVRKKSKYFSSNFSLFFLHRKSRQPSSTQRRPLSTLWEVLFFLLLLLSALCAVCWRKSSSRWRVYDIRLRRLTNETRGRKKKIAGEKEKE